jgi:SWIM zinc finger
MIQLVSAGQLSKATERAKAGNLFVKPSSLFRQYHVTNRETGARYMVDFFVRKSDGARFGHCTCKAGQNNIACKHMSAAAGYHIMRVATMREAERVAQMPQAA